jgi:hypothetical protein
MNFFELRGTSIITERKINDINTIKSKMESRLNSMKARTYVSDNVITFSTLKFYVPSGSLMNRSDSLRIIKEGKIGINKENHSLNISWSVKLDSLYFLALCCSVVAGTAIRLYANTELIISVSIGILFFLMFVFIGIVLIKAQLNDLINSSVYRNYY